MKKCKGCGESLQYTNKDEVGYAPNETFDYCQRCFRLTHYGDLKGTKKTLEENINVFDSIDSIKDAMFIYIVDCFDAIYLDQDKLLQKYLDKNILIVINKIDLLPKNFNDDKITNIYLESLNKYNDKKNIQCVITYKNDPSFNELFFNILKDNKVKKAVFIGRVNAGKSTLINKLIENKDLTTSIYPGTTTNLNEIKFNGYTFIDSPGILDEESFITYVDNKKIKNILPLKTLKSQVFQLYENQSYFVEGLLEVDIEPLNRASALFIINNNIEVHRTKYSNKERYLERNEKFFNIKLLPFKDNKFTVNKFYTFYLKGLGLIKINGKCKVNIRVNDKIKVYKKEVNI